MTTFQLRRDTAANWATVNPILAAGEPGYDTTGGILKVGDGATAWVDLPGYLNEPAIDGQIGSAPGIPHGDPARGYGMVLGVIRNEGSGWATIDDGAHVPSRIGAVVTTLNDIYVNYALGATPASVGTFLAVPDEALTKAGFSLGLSIAVDHARIEMYRRFNEIADYIYFDGTNWVSSHGNFSAVWSGTYLTLTHAGDFAGATLPIDVRNIAHVTQAGGGCEAFYRNATATTVEVLFTNHAGTLLTTPATTMKFVVTHGASTLQRVDAATVTTTEFPASNIWLFGVPNMA